jgi:membrane protein implicated in regulation of membrane protease activity
MSMQRRSKLATAGRVLAMGALAASAIIAIVTGNYVVGFVFAPVAILIVILFIAARRVENRQEAKRRRGRR